MARKTIIHKTIQVASSTLVSRVLGIMREILTLKYLGAGALSDAFFTAFAIPNLFRKIFAEGALSAAFIPVFIKVLREHGARAAQQLLTQCIITFGAALALFALIFAWQTPFLIKLWVPGFSQEQVLATVPLARIFIPFIMLVSAGALLAGPLQAAGHFFIPAFGQVLINGSAIFGLLLCIYFQWPVSYWCWFYVVGGLLYFLAHIITYWYWNLSFPLKRSSSWQSVRTVLKNFVFCFMSVGVGELSLIIDRAFASYLPVGSLSLIYYGNRFMGIPLGVFAVAFSTILLPHFARITTYAPKRLGFYLLESAKLVLWVSVPVMLVMIFCASTIFKTFSSTFSPEQVKQAAHVLIAFVAGLFFFSLNKIVLNIYYALEQTHIPTLIALLATLANVILNVLLMPWLGATGLALSTTICGMLQTVLLLVCLAGRQGITIYIRPFMSFACRLIIHHILAFIVFVLSYHGILAAIAQLPEPYAHFFTDQIGIWLWVGPLAVGLMALIYGTGRWFGITLYFLDY